MQETPNKVKGSRSFKFNTLKDWLVYSRLALIAERQRYTYINLINTIESLWTHESFLT